MTEAEWLNSADAHAMLQSLKSHATDRKLRLYGCARYRRFWGLLSDDRVRELVEITEKFADGEISWKRLRRAWGRPQSGERSLDGLGRIVERRITVNTFSCDHLSWLLAWQKGILDWMKQEPIRRDQAKADANILREIFGNPFRPVTVSSAWQTANVVAIAQTIYDNRGFDRMPILADALEDAGCTDTDILNHCRQPGEHVRGCWVVDLVLKKN